MKIINGNEFTKISHFYLDEHIKGGNLSKEILQKDAVIFCKLDYTDKLFNFIKFSNKNYILITHNSDYGINVDIFNEKPTSIKKWFGQNVNYYHQDLINIPIGLENEIRNPPAIPRVDYKWFKRNLKLFQDTKKKSIVYCNWNPETSPSRNNIINDLKNNQIPIEIEDDRLNHKNYCKKLSQYKFVLCPPGNGVSTHRFWETLYLGSIPIVINHRIYKDYTLPMIRLNKWSDLTNNILTNFDETKYSKEQLDFNYWKNLILNTKL